MSQWKIEYCVASVGKHAIEKWLDSLSKEEFHSVVKEITILHAMGNKLGLPHCRLLGKKLFELRERRYGYRIYYGFLDDHAIVLLVAGNKKTQPQDILIARDRLLEHQKGGSVHEEKEFSALC